jgi:hypothetical protein
MDLQLTQEFFKCNTNTSGSAAQNTGVKIPDPPAPPEADKIGGTGI